jgi:hypothetical protein
MRGIKARIAASAVAAALVVSSTAAGAAPLPAPAAPQTALSPWLALSMMTQGGTIGLGGAAARPENALPPPPPPPPPGYGSVQTPPIPVIAVWLATLAMAIYIATADHRGHGEFPLPNSAA